MTLTLSIVLVLATPDFPAQLATLSGGPVPGCAVCHQGGVTGRGTVTTPFGASLRARGLVAYDAASLQSAWEQLGTEDSDGDGVTDVTELANDGDPNGGNPNGGPHYGCSSTSLAPQLALALVLAFSARRRSRLRLRVPSVGLDQGKFIRSQMLKGEDPTVPLKPVAGDRGT